MTEPAAPGQRDVALSIVIPTYRREQVLCDTLRRLLGLGLDGCEVIVVDQTATHEPATWAFLATIGDRITLLRLDAPSLPRARNVGWRAARGTIILFLDDDAIPHPGLIEAHLRAYEEPGVGGVAGRILTRGFPLPDTPSRKSRLPAVGWLFFNFAQTVPCEVQTARGCHMSYRRRLLEEVGGFDERYAPSPASREETDLCFRARRLGFRLMFEPRAVVEHLAHGEGGERGPERDLGLVPSHHVNNFYFFWRNVPRRHRPLTFLILLIQEFRPRQAGVGRRAWPDRLRVLGLFLRGVWIGWRRAHSTAVAEAAARTGP